MAVLRISFYKNVAGFSPTSGINVSVGRDAKPRCTFPFICLRYCYGNTACSRDNVGAHVVNTNNERNDNNKTRLNVIYIFLKRFETVRTHEFDTKHTFS